MHLDEALVEEARALHRETPVVDLHQDTLLWSRLLGYDLLASHRPLTHRLGLAPPLWGQSDLPRLLTGLVSGLGLGIVTSPFCPQRAFQAALVSLRQFAGLVERAAGRLVAAQRAEDIVRAATRNQVAAFPVLEGVHCLPAGVRDLPRLVAAGLKGVGFVHFTRSWAGCSSSSAGGNLPLTDEGRELVDECNRLKLLLDLAHLNGPGSLEAAARSRQPVVISHTGVAGVYPHWRNVEDRLLRLIAERGGCIGLICYPWYLGPGVCCDVTRIIEHAAHLVRVAGEDAVALGSDIDGFLPNLARPLRGSADLPRLTAAFLQAGWPPERIRKLLGLNALRVLAAVWGN